MDHSLYPIGSYQCSLYFASYAWQKKDVRYVWKAQNPINVPSSDWIKLYSLATPAETRYEDVITTTGMYLI